MPSVYAVRLLKGVACLAPELLDYPPRSMDELVYIHTLLILCCCPVEYELSLPLETATN